MVEVTVVGIHVRVTEGVREYAVGKTEKLDRFHLTKVEVILSNEAARYKAEMIASSRRGKRFVAHAEGEDLHGAIDLTVEKLESQLSRRKGKAMEKRGRRLRPDLVAEQESVEPDDAESLDLEE